MEQTTDFKQYFENTFSEVLERVGIKKQDSEFSSESFYFQDYSSINEHYLAEMYDIEGGQLWITLRCPFPGSDNKFLIQINIRHFDKLLFKGRPNVDDLNVVCGRILFIYDWQTLASYDFDFKKHRGIPFSKKDKIYRKYINNGIWSCFRFHYYDLDSEFIDTINAITEIARSYVRNFQKKEFFQELESSKSVYKRDKAFRKYIKEDVMTEFGQYLEYIR